ncbi:MAG: hypothetical protein R3E97_11545 [Candidatus Eisenbacteria bacterium]
MKRCTLLILLTLLVAPVVGCQEERVTAPTNDETIRPTAFDAQAVATQVIRLAGWSDPSTGPSGDAAAQGVHDDIVFVGRAMITEDVAHYEWQVRVGPGPYDVIGLHRIVREEAPLRPIRTRQNVMMMHGDYKTFVGCFQPGLLTDSRPPDFGIASHLALQDIDVWGIDQPWCLVPDGTMDFAFTADWGMDRQIDFLTSAMQVARQVRRLTRNGNDRMNLLGFSGGAALGLALVGEESQMPPGRRQVSGLIPVDQGLVVSDNPEHEEGLCDVVAYYRGLLDAGEYAEVNPLPLFGGPARDDPNGPSELIPGMTNLQAALALAVYPYYSWAPSHFVAGTFDEEELPTGLQYTDVGLWIDFLIKAPPYFPNAFNHDEYLAECDPGLAPWTDHIGDVEVPIFVVGGQGGFAPLYDFSDVTSEFTELIVSLHPPEEAYLDYAHIDLFTADMAPELVWNPIAQWIHGHTGPGHGAEPESAEATPR